MEKININLINNIIDSRILLNLNQFNKFKNGGMRLSEFPEYLRSSKIYENMTNSFDVSDPDTDFQILDQICKQNYDRVCKPNCEIHNMEDLSYLLETIHFWEIPVPIEVYRFILTNQDENYSIFINPHIAEEIIDYWDDLDSDDEISDGEDSEDEDDDHIWNFAKPDEICEHDKRSQALEFGRSQALEFGRSQEFDIHPDSEFESLSQPTRSERSEISLKPKLFDFYPELKFLVRAIKLRKLRSIQNMIFVAKHNYILLMTALSEQDSRLLSQYRLLPPQYSPWSKQVCATATKYGNINCLKYAHVHRCPWDKQTSFFAVKNKDLETLRYVHEFESSSCALSDYKDGNGHKIYAMAAKNGDLAT